MYTCVASKPFSKERITPEFSPDTNVCWESLKKLAPGRPQQRRWEARQAPLHTLIDSGDEGRYIEKGREGGGGGGVRGEEERAAGGSLGPR